jgi:hypothetical protein
MCFREEVIGKYMIKELKIDKINGIVVLEITKNDLGKMVNSVNNMADKQQKNTAGKSPIRRSDRRS